MPAATSSNTLQHAIMKFILQGDTGINTVLPAAATGDFYIGLFTTLPTASTAGTEVSGGGYSRKSIKRDSGSGGWGVSGSGTSLEIVNTDDITFDPPSGTWGTIVGGGLFNGSGGGADLLYWAQLQTSKTVSAGDGAPKILAGQFRIGRATCP